MHAFYEHEHLARCFDDIYKTEEYTLWHALNISSQWKYK